MYASLGDIVFEGLYGFDSFESTENPTYAQHELIGAKPVLQPTGYELEEIRVTIRMRAEFVIPSEALQALRTAKDRFEVLPLVRGSGQYLGDFVIAEMSRAEMQNLPDGTIVQADVTLTLREYASTDKLQQQQVAARKAAFASGVRQPISVAAKQLPTIPQVTAQDLTITASHANIVGDQVTAYQNNVSGREPIARRIQRNLTRMDERLTAFSTGIAGIPGLSNPGQILDNVQAVRNAMQLFAFPVADPVSLLTSNEILQTAMENLAKGSTEILQSVITRLG